MRNYYQTNFFRKFVQCRDEFNSMNSTEKNGDEFRHNHYYPVGQFLKYTTCHSGLHFSHTSLSTFKYFVRIILKLNTFSSF